MALSEKQIEEIKNELDTSHNPLFFFDDDPDGLTSFLLFYRYLKEGKGVVIKARPTVEEMFTKKVEEYSPDKIFILDKPDISQDFIDKVNTKIIWIDHHEPKPKPNVKYFNPMIQDNKDNRSVSYWCYKVVNQDLWIAMVGIVGDWQLPKLAETFSKEYPDLLPLKIKTPQDALYKTELGKLIKIFSFILKGKTTEVNKYIKILTRINSPYEILKQETSQGKYIYKKYTKINKLYIKILDEAKNEAKNSGKLLVFKYNDDKMSFTGDLSNELLYLYPEKIILIARSKNGEMKCSLRSASIKLLPALKKALQGINGYGGGHEMACGACVKIEHWEDFIKNLEKEIS